METPMPFEEEALLRVFLELTATIWDRQMVAGMTFNEAFVCNLLSHRQETDPDQPMTATELCEKTNLHKSQISSVLTNLEAQGFLCRSRNSRDRRQMALHLTQEGRSAYQQAHQGAAALLSAVVSHMGAENARLLTELLHDANATVQSQLTQRRQKGTL